MIKTIKLITFIVVALAWTAFTFSAVIAAGGILNLLAAMILTAGVVYWAIFT